VHTIETVLTVTPEGVIVIPVVAKLPPGEHRAVIVIEETPASDQETPVTTPPLPLGRNQPLNLRTFPLTSWPQDSTYSRLDIYGDDGR
jgi:hypothetical protein